MARRAASDAAVLAQIPAARRRAEREVAAQPRIADAHYEPAGRRLHLTLTNGTVVAIPIAMVGSLRRASDQELADVAVGVAGIGLHWARLDEDLSLSGLLRLTFGARALHRAAGAAGGEARTAAKARAARKNGLKGGRPRKRRVKTAA